MEPKVKKAFAGQLATNELLWSILEREKQDQMNTWQSLLGVENVNAREDCHTMVAAINRLEQIIKNEVSDLTRN